MATDLQVCVTHQTYTHAQSSHVDIISVPVTMDSGDATGTDLLHPLNVRYSNTGRKQELIKQVE